jgi:exonuclease 1
LQGATKKSVEAIEINQQMVRRLTSELARLNIKYIVAPYEADAQLAFLYKDRQIDLVITEDSDLLLFGVTKVFFKMDLNGRGVEINLKNLSLCDDFKYLSTNSEKEVTEET